VSADGSWGEDVMFLKMWDIDGRGREGGREGVGTVLNQTTARKPGLL
jgi:hypothetical protein